MRIASKSQCALPLIVTLILAACDQYKPKHEMKYSADLKNQSFDFFTQSGQILVHRVNAFSGRSSKYIYRRADNTFEGFRIIDSKAQSCNAEIVPLVTVDESQKIALLEYFKTLKVIKINSKNEANTTIDGDFENVQSYKTESEMNRNDSVEYGTYGLHEIDFQKSENFINQVARNFKVKKASIQWDGREYVVTECVE